MKHRFNQEWLTKKFREIQSRTLRAVEQLSDDQLNWRPNEASHSIAALIRHIEGNIQERIEKGILYRDVCRNRERELSHEYTAKGELIAILQEKFDFVVDLVSRLTDEQFDQTQLVRNRERTNADMLHQCAAHYSEHMGQIFYIAKISLNERYSSTSI